MIKTLGRYQIDTELGQGAMGTVYKALDPLLDRVVAIKTVNLNLPKDEVAEYEARFYQEAKAAGQLSHPNIVTIYDIGKSDNLAYMAMEFLQGEELRRQIAADTPIAIETALDIGAQIAEGLNYAHAHEIIHRDIKPGNVMVLPDGLIKITDFGIARMRNTEVKTMTGMILGSPKYMSPEQVAGKRADHRSDIFSAGVVIFEMLTGASPFVADNIHGVMYQTLNFDPPAPKTLNPDLPQVVNYIVAKVLAKNRDDRYQSAKDLASDLRQARAEFVDGSAAALIASLPGQPRPFQEPPVPLTREKDKPVSAFATQDDADDGNMDAHRDPGAESGDASGPVLSLAGGFDSSDATMRLAAITGLEHNVDAFAGSHKIENQTAQSTSDPSDAPTFASKSPDWTNGSAAANINPTDKTVNGTLRNIWICSAVLLLGTIVLVILA